MDVDHSLAGGGDFINCFSLKDVPAAAAASNQNQLAPHALSLFVEGICHILSHWVSLVKSTAFHKRIPFIETTEYLTRNRGKFASMEAEELASDIFIWFAQSKDERKVKSLGYLIQEIVRHKFKCAVGDGSTILVSSKLKMLHQELVQGNLESIQELRQSTGWIGQATFDRIKKDEHEDRLLQKTRPHLRIKKQPKRSSMATRKRQIHPKRLELLLSSLRISDC